MTKILCILAILFLSLPSSNASLRSLIQKTYDTNLALMDARDEVTISQADTRILNASLDLNLQFESSYTDSNFERDPFSLVSANQAWVNELTLAKPFSWGGELSLVSTHQHLKPKSSISQSYLFQQRLTYTQDFGRNIFGRTFNLEEKTLRANEQVLSLTLNSSEISQLITLSKLYVEGSSLQLLLELERAALLRVDKRLKYVRKQVRDGLREKVDELRARESLLARETAIRDIENRMWSLKEELGVVIADQALDVKFNPKGLKQDWTKSWKGWHLKENVDRQLLIKRLDALSLQAKARSQKDVPDIKLFASYGNNDWELNRADAISGGILGTKNDEIALGVQINFALGNEEQKAELAKVNARKKTLERYSSQWNKILLGTAATLGERHKNLALNLKTAQERESLARQALDAYSKLYAKGRVDLDQVITAEELLISDQKLVVSSRQSLVNLTIEAQALAGRLPNFLLKEVDL